MKVIRNIGEFMGQGAGCVNVTVEFLKEERERFLTLKRLEITEREDGSVSLEMSLLKEEREELIPVIASLYLALQKDSEIRKKHLIFEKSV